MKLTSLVLISQLMCVVSLSAEEEREQLGFEGEQANNQVEFEKLFQDHFNQIDTNRDGTIDYKELEGRFRTKMDTRYKKLAEKYMTENRATFDDADTDNDGKLSKEEFTSKHGTALEVAEDFMFWDSNEDSAIDWVEYQDYLEPYKSSRRQQHITMKAQHDMDAIAQEKGAIAITWSQYKKWSGAQDDEKKFFDKYDANSDGKLNPAEYEAWHGEMFGNHSSDPVRDELGYILHTLTDHKHQEHSEEPKAAEYITVTFDQAKQHSEFFVGWHRQTHEEL